MQIKDIMQTNVAAVLPDDEVARAARIMIDRRVSGLPVIDRDKKVVGVITEGDFLERAELGGRAPRSWWLDLVGGADPGAYVRAHAKYVRDAMTSDVQMISPDASLAAAAMALERRGVKRLPVVVDGKLVGIVSRADIVRAVASAQPTTPEANSSDDEIRQSIQHALADGPDFVGLQATTIVRDGVVELWGLANSQDEIDAARVLAEQTPGVTDVQVHINRFPVAYYA